MDIVSSFRILWIVRTVFLVSGVWLILAISLQVCFVIHEAYIAPLMDTTFSLNIRIFNVICLSCRSTIHCNRYVSPHNIAIAM